MKKTKLITLVLIGVLSVLMIPSLTFAENTSSAKRKPGFTLSGRQHSLSVDIVRLVDEAQYRGLLNLYYQCSINKQSAVVLGLSHGHDVTIFEAAYKYYLKKYFDGPFAQVGAVIGDYDEEGTEAGITGALGYEMSLARHLVITGAVELTAGTMDNPSTGDGDPIFRPILGITFAF